MSEKKPIVWAWHANGRWNFTTKLDEAKGVLWAPHEVVRLTPAGPDDLAVFNAAQGKRASKRRAAA